ncbi:MAG: SxtJ family membrane protein [Candidatus Omnitrophota bacterium]
MDHKKVTNRDLRQFGIVLGLLLGVLGAVSMFKGHYYRVPWFFGGSFVSLAAGIFFPRRLKPVYRVFIKIAHAIGWVNTRLILIVVYYFLLTPIGLLMRVFTKDPLNRKIDRGCGSYWIKRKNVFCPKEELKNQY